jgi:hypothetical protein
MRVQIPAYTDSWMKGDRFGDIVKVTRVRRNARQHAGAKIAHVKLDVSGKTRGFMLDDCTVVEPTPVVPAAAPEPKKITPKDVEDALRKRFPGLGDRLIVI